MVALDRLLKLTHVLVDAALGDKRLQVLQVISLIPVIADSLVNRRVAGAGDVVLVHRH